MQENSNIHGFSNHELVAAFIEKRLSDNLAAFKEFYPEIYDCFSSYRESRYYLIYDQFGNVNIFDHVKESLAYTGNPVEQCLSNWNEYKKYPVVKSFLISSSGKDSADETNYVHSDLLNKISSYQRKVIDKAYDDRLSIANSGFFQPGAVIKCMFVFSTGIGFDIEKIYFDHDVKNFFIVEPNLDLFYASMQMVDWKAIIDKSRDKGLNLYFALGDDLINSIANLSSHAGRQNLSGSFFYSAFYDTSNSELFKDVKDLIQYGLLSGFGFYDDSRYSIAHTAGNIQSGVPFYSTNRSFNKSLGQSGIPVFIVGNGPSLDNDIDFIKKNQSGAVIFSCGSSLRSLLVNDIIPDFYVEMERTSIVTYFINKTSYGIEDYYKKIKDICFVGVSQVDPEAFSLFDRKGMILKDSESGSMMVRKSYPDAGIPLLPRLAPSCVHTGLTLSVILGFKEIYLFGTDMGTLDVSQHHSKYSLYNKATEETEKRLAISQRGEKFKSNFDDKTVYSSGFYPVAKRELESIISGWKGNVFHELNFYNCSDGAYIENTIPTRSHELSFSPIENKRALVDSIFNAHFSFYPQGGVDDLIRFLSVIKDKVDILCDWAINVLRPAESLIDAHNLLDRFGVEFHSEAVLSDEDVWLYSLFDGTLLYSISVINTTLQMPLDEKSLLIEVNHQLCELKNFFEVVKVDFRENCLEWDKEERHATFLGKDKESDEPKSGEVS